MVVSGIRRKSKRKIIIFNLNKGYVLEKTPLGEHNIKTKLKMIGYIEYYPCNRPEVRCNRNDSGTEAERYNATGKILSGKIDMCE